MKKTSDLPHTETVRSQTVKNFYFICIHGKSWKYMTTAEQKRLLYSYTLFNSDPVLLLRPWESQLSILFHLPFLSSGYSQSASLLAHNRITAPQFIRLNFQIINLFKTEMHCYCNRPTLKKQPCFTNFYIKFC